MKTQLETRTEYLDALMEMETLLQAPPDSEDALRRDQLAESILQYASILDSAPHWLCDA